MKKLISLILVAVMCLTPLSICAFAVEDAPVDVCYITLPESYAYTVTPCEGYDCYVIKGQDFKFRVTPKKGYSLDMVLVHYFPTSPTGSLNSEGYFQQEAVRNPSSNVYTIDIVNEDLTVSVDQVLQTGSATMFRTLMEFIQRLFKAIGKLLGINVDPAQ